MILFSVAGNNITQWVIDEQNMFFMFENSINTYCSWAFQQVPTNKRGCISTQSFCDFEDHEVW